MCYTQFYNNITTKRIGDISHQQACGDHSLILHGATKIYRGFSKLRHPRWCVTQMQPMVLEYLHTTKPGHKYGVNVGKYSSTMLRIWVMYKLIST